MIEDIEITNFRCFDRLKVSGCKRINLISGKNNVGKTALLEAIYLNSMPTKETILSLGNSRGESRIIRRKLSEKTWGNLFFNQDVDSFFFIKTIFQNEAFKKIGVEIKDKKHLLDQIGSKMPVELTEEYKDWIEKQYITIISEDEKYVGLMTIKANNYDVYQLINLSKNREINVGENSSKSLYIQNASFISSTLRNSNSSLTREFDNARLNEKDDEVLRAFQIIDSSIIAVESFSIPEPTIYLKRQGGKRLPLSLFGDAMNRIADIILKVINNQDSILLIDEIENGIHHSNQIALWDFLYKLAEQLNVQIFATTHSLEMTEAFIKAGLDRPDSAAHFELTRHEKTNQIVAINRDLETLEYAIDRHKEVRGGA